MVEFSHGKVDVVVPADLEHEREGVVRTNKRSVEHYSEVGENFDVAPTSRSRLVAFFIVSKLLPQYSSGHPKCQNTMMR